MKRNQQGNYQVELSRSDIMVTSQPGFARWLEPVLFRNKQVVSVEDRDPKHGFFVTFVSVEKKRKDGVH